MRVLSKMAGYPRMLLAGGPPRIELGTLFVGFVCACASGVPFPLIGILFGQLLDDFNEATCSASAGTATASSDASEQSDINGKILIIVYLAIAQFVTIYLHLSCWTMYGARLAQRLRERYLQNLLRQEPSYFDNLPPGEVASRLNTDIQTIRSGSSEKAGICISSFSFFITAYIVAFIKQSILAAMLISLIPAYFLMSFIGSHYIEKYSARVSDYAASAASIASEALSNLVVVQAFGANTRLEEKFSKALKESEREGMKKATAVGVQAGFLYFIAYSANGLAFWQGSRKVADSVDGGDAGTTVGSVFTVIFILVEATLLLSQVAPFLHLFTAAVASFEKLHGDIYREPQIDGTTDAGLRLTEAQGAFEFKNVSFCYPSRPEVTVLDNISLSIPANKHTALVGLSGSGKSTIAGLVTRLYDPDQGEIFFDGHNLREVNTRDLRSYLSLVQQEPSLLDRSLLENIAHGLMSSSNPSHTELKAALLASDLEGLAAEVRGGVDLMVAAESRGSEVVKIVNLVKEAANLADAHGFISNLHHGYATSVGSSGRLISGGQKQRVSLARALIRDPTVLILDEATASLDSRTERRIQDAINRIASGRTMITIAHRLSTITNADNIIVMHKGHIIEQGSHSELMAQNGSYANLVYMQGLGGTTNKNDATVSIESVSKSDQTSTTDTDIEKVSTSNEFEPADEHKATATETPVTDAPEEEEGLETPSKSLWQILRGYGPAVKPHLLIIFFALIGSVIVGGAFSGEAVIFGNTVGSLNPCKSADSIRSKGDFFGLMFFVLAIIEFFSNLVSWAGFGWASEKIVYTVRVLSFRSLFEQDLQWHQSNGRSPPLLLSYITRDGNALAGLSGSVIGTLISITVNLIAAIILTHIIAWKIALVCLALVPLLLGAGLMELHVLGKFEEKHETAYTKSVDIGVEAITSIKTIASLSLEHDILKTYRKSLKGPRKETLQVTLHASLWQATTYFLGNCVNALAYWWGAKQIIAGTYTQTQFLIVVFSLLVSALLWSQMFALAPELTNARNAMARILGLIEIGSEGMKGKVPTHAEIDSAEKDPEMTAELKPIVSDNTASGVQFRDVHFAYPARPDSKILNGLSMDIRPGKFAALVGPSGAGKSTIISLVERLYTPEAGSILVDGFDVTKGHSVSFRDSISLVPQESVLFEGTIEFNIGLGAAPGRNVTLADIEDACKLANIHDTIMSLPDGYQTLCGPNGSQFSGGQKQRLSIARALVRKPKLLILDESTSALDAESEKLLQDGLEKAARGITVIAIAHRLRTIRKADVIFLIEAGRCVDHGSHEQLLERSESYRANVMHQTVATD
ncbi:P-loop containing nucleoside triphosphate hydrolase protein [Penicillium argentinense]|uniref:P-loop containing nucleoside triphosphate hydrolase protein n=1 Tax=Penicillium argentinense TaxID=1131581 RepID=A0A9W9G2Y6_9EURO|nr:P-loop containing nucleoside triphosphate hydrolase protein [Penicillium argentinense]KAJ5111021.1 P-loop containing nucleoside triphosphate hydrolase protein [Penicillium argentinense]